MCDTRTLFARHGLRCTRQRVELYDALCAAEKHPTAEELYWATRNSDAGLSLATVYNTLEAFCKHRLCRKLPSTGGGGGSARYDADLSEHHHVVTGNGEVRDVPPDLGARMLESLPKGLVCELERRMGVEVRRVRIEFFAQEAPQPVAAAASRSC